MCVFGSFLGEFKPLLLYLLYFTECGFFFSPHLLNLYCQLYTP